MQLKALDDVIAVGGYATSRRLSSLAIAHFESASVESALKMVAKGRGLFYNNLENSLYIAKSEGLSDQLKFHMLNDRDLLPFHICFSRNKEGIKPIVEKFNRGLAIIRANGIYDEIYDRYR